MQKIILVDGNNLMFRSYYATAYNGNFMNNSKGFPTNALFGFTNMMNKIIKEENPEYIIVAFDMGKTFRHEKYEGYKDGRVETPNELKIQFPLAKKLLTAMGIKYYETEGFEADDIIGTFSKYCDHNDYKGLIVSSDKDLLQLINEDVDIKLLKQKDYIRYNVESFKADYGIEPINIIDLKALMGDSSDNIPGVKGVGEKTALKLLQQYQTLDGIYEHIDEIKGKLKEKLINDKDNAYMSYDLATIITDVPMDINLNDTRYVGENIDELNKLYVDIEFYSFLKKKEVKEEPLKISMASSLNDLDIKEPVAVYLEVLGHNYHQAEILGMGIYNKNISLFIPLDLIKQNPPFLQKTPKYTYDLKKLIVSLKYQNIEVSNFVFDSFIAGSLLDYNVKEDIAYLASELGYNISFYESVYGKENKLIKPSLEEIANNCVQKAKFIYDSKNLIENKLKDEQMIDLFNNIEMPLASVLADMEHTGVKVDANVLKEIGDDISLKLELLTKDIYNYAGEEFNISSPKQLSYILFEKLNLKHGKKTANGYSTSADVLNKLASDHPIINLILDYRTLTKTYSNYVVGLLDSIKDGKVHTIYTQNYTRTGRLSSTEPNLQNIPIKEGHGREIRKAFIPEGKYMLSADYSQIELRILAHIASVQALITAFKEDRDIHAKTASDIFKVSIDVVNSNMRRIAKAVNFGIIYGISSFGLASNLNISTSEAKEFIDTYLHTYPGIKDYMDDTVAKAKADGYVKTLYGRKRLIPELKNTVYTIRQSGERIALNTPIQGTSADIIKLAMVNVYKSINEHGLKSKMIMQVHDELIFDVVGGELDDLTKIVKEEMENVCKLTVPLRADVNYGTNWYDAK